MLAFPVREDELQARRVRRERLGGERPGRARGAGRVRDGDVLRRQPEQGADEEGRPHLAHAHRERPREERRLRGGGLRREGARRPGAAAEGTSRRELPHRPHPPAAGQGVGRAGARREGRPRGSVRAARDPRRAAAGARVRTRPRRRRRGLFRPRGAGAAVLQRNLQPRAGGTHRRGGGEGAQRRAARDAVRTSAGRRHVQSDIFAPHRRDAAGRGLRRVRRVDRRRRAPRGARGGRRADGGVSRRDVHGRARSEDGRPHREARQRRCGAARGHLVRGAPAARMAHAAAHVPRCAGRARRHVRADVPHGRGGAHPAASRRPRAVRGRGRLHVRGRAQPPLDDGRDARPSRASEFERGRVARRADGPDRGGRRDAPAPFVRTRRTAAAGCASARRLARARLPGGGLVQRVAAAASLHARGNAPRLRRTRLRGRRRPVRGAHQHDNDPTRHGAGVDEGRRRVPQWRTHSADVQDAEDSCARGLQPDDREVSLQARQGDRPPAAFGVPVGCFHVLAVRGVSEIDRAERGHQDRRQDGIPA